MVSTSSSNSSESSHDSSEISFNSNTTKQEPNYDCTGDRINIDDVIVTHGSSTAKTLERLENRTNELKVDCDIFITKTKRFLDPNADNSYATMRGFELRKNLRDLINECENYISLTNDMITFLKKEQAYMDENVYYRKDYETIVGNSKKILRGAKSTFKSYLSDLKDKLEDA